MQSSPIKATSLSLAKTKQSLFSSSSSFGYWVMLAFSLFLTQLLPFFGYLKKRFSNLPFLVGFQDLDDDFFETLSNAFYSLFEESDSLKELFSSDLSVWNDFLGELGISSSQLLSFFTILCLGGLFLYIVATFLGSFLGGRGLFVYLHAVTTPKTTLFDAWKAVSKEATSLMLFQILVAFLLFPLFLLLSFLMLFPIVEQLVQAIEMQSMLHFFASPKLLFLLLFFFLVFALSFLIALFKDFVIPIAFLRKSSIFQAIAITFNEFLPGKWLEVILYFLFKKLLEVAIAMIIAIGGVFSFFIGYLLLLIPFVAILVLLPFIVFLTHYNLSFISGYGVLWDFYPQTTSSFTEQKAQISNDSFDPNLSGESSDDGK